MQVRVCARARANAAGCPPPATHSGSRSMLSSIASAAIGPPATTTPAADLQGRIETCECEGVKGRRTGGRNRRLYLRRASEQRCRCRRTVRATQSVEEEPADPLQRTKDILAVVLQLPPQLLMASSSMSRTLASRSRRRCARRRGAAHPRTGRESAQSGAPAHAVWRLIATESLARER